MQSIPDNYILNFRILKSQTYNELFMILPSDKV